jgi:hypothetical protein
MFRNPSIIGPYYSMKRGKNKAGAPPPNRRLTPPGNPSAIRSVRGQTPPPTSGVGVRPQKTTDTLALPWPPHEGTKQEKHLRPAGPARPLHAHHAANQPGEAMHARHGSAPKDDNGGPGRGSPGDGISRSERVGPRACPGWSPDTFLQGALPKILPRIASPALR